MIWADTPRHTLALYIGLHLGCTIPDIVRCRALWQNREALQPREGQRRIRCANGAAYQDLSPLYTHPNEGAKRSARGAASCTGDRHVRAGPAIGGHNGAEILHLHAPRPQEERGCCGHVRYEVPSAMATPLDADHQECAARQRTHQPGGSHVVVCGTASAHTAKHSLPLYA